jgi:hypothetical protein
MSKRSKPDSSSSHDKTNTLEQKLFELQGFSFDVLVKNSASATKNGSVRCTRAFADPLLLKEIQILRTRETELVEKVVELEKRGIPPGNKAKDDLIEELRLENEKLREQVGDTSRQVGALRLDMKDRTIGALERALAEAKGTITKKDALIHAAESKIFALEVEIKKKMDDSAKDDNMESFFTKGE